MFTEADIHKMTFKKCYVEMEEEGYHCGMNFVLFVCILLLTNSIKIVQKYVLLFFFAGQGHHTSGNTKFDWGPFEISWERCRELHTFRTFTPTGRKTQSYRLNVSSFLSNVMTQRNMIIVLCLSDGGQQIQTLPYW